MIDRKTEPVFGVERRLRVYPHISSLSGRQLITRKGYFGKGCKNYSIMHIKAFKLPGKNILYLPNNRIFEEGDSRFSKSSRYNPYPSDIRHRTLHEPPGIAIWPDPPDRYGSQLITNYGDNTSVPLFSTGAPPVQNKNNFHNKKNRPFLTRLVGDPIGKEADGETNIGEQNNVTKYIN